MGNVGGGTGMITYDFKGGSSTASRLLNIGGQHYTLGVFVQSNFGQREDLMVRGVPVGRLLTEGKLRWKEQGSIIAIIATERTTLATPAQATCAARAFGPCPHRHHWWQWIRRHLPRPSRLRMRRHTPRTAWRGKAGGLAMQPWIVCSAQLLRATEEAVIDAMITGETMTGRDGNVAVALPHAELLDLMQRYGR